MRQPPQFRPMPRPCSVATAMIGAVVCVLALMSVASPSSLLAADGFAEPVDREFTARLDGSIQKYVELSPTGLDSARPVDVVIALHGHGSDRWQYIREARGECRGVRDVAARRGMVFVSPDYRAKTSWMGPAAESDLVQLIALLKERYRVRRTYLAGGSMGGTSALIFAVLHPSLVDGVLSENGTANMLEYDGFQEAIVASYGGTKQDRREEFQRRSPELSAERLTMPVALTVGGKDTLVPPHSVRRLAARLKEAGRKDVLLVDDQEGGHATGYDDTVSAFEFVIRAAESRLGDSQ